MSAPHRAVPYTRAAVSPHYTTPIQTHRQLLRLCTVAVQNFIAQEFEKRLVRVQGKGAPDLWEAHWIVRMDEDKEAVLTEVKARAAKWWTQDDVGPKSAKFHFRQLQGAKRKAADDAAQSASKRAC